MPNRANLGDSREVSIAVDKERVVLASELCYFAGSRSGRVSQGTPWYEKPRLLELEMRIGRETILGQLRRRYRSCERGIGLPSPESRSRRNVERYAVDDETRSR